MHVAFIGSGAVERQRSEKAAAGLLEDYAHRDGAEPEAAVFAGQLWPIDAGFARLLTKSFDVRRFFLRGDDFIAHERCHAIAQLDEVAGKFEIHVSFGDSRKWWPPPARRPRTS